MEFNEKNFQRYYIVPRNWQATVVLRSKAPYNTLECVEACLAGNMFLPGWDKPDFCIRVNVTPGFPFVPAENRCFYRAKEIIRADHSELKVLQETQKAIGQIGILSYMGTGYLDCLIDRRAAQKPLLDMLKANNFIGITQLRFSE